MSSSVGFEKVIGNYCGSWWWDTTTFILVLCFWHCWLSRRIYCRDSESIAQACEGRVVIMCWIFGLELVLKENITPFSFSLFLGKRARNRDMLFPIIHDRRNAVWKNLPDSIPHSRRSILLPHGNINSLTSFLLWGIRFGQILLFSWRFLRLFLFSSGPFVGASP